jgi:hypothetical protein
LGHQTNGPKVILENFEEDTAPPAKEGAAYNLNSRSRLASLIDVKISKEAFV